MDFSDLLLAKVPWPSLDESGAWGQTQLVPSLLPTWLCLRSGAPGLRPLFPSLLEAQSMMVAIRARALLDVCVEKQMFFPFRKSRETSHMGTAG